MGTLQHLDPVVAARRQATWLAWYGKDKDNGGESFQRHDLPSIVREFHEIWDVDVPGGEKGEGRLPEQTLSAVGKEESSPPPRPFSTLSVHTAATFCNSLDMVPNVCIRQARIANRSHILSRDLSVPKNDIIP